MSRVNRLSLSCLMLAPHKKRGTPSHHRRQQIAPFRSSFSENPDRSLILSEPKHVSGPFVSRFHFDRAEKTLVRQLLGDRPMREVSCWKDLVSRGPPSYLNLFLTFLIPLVH